MSLSGGLSAGLVRQLSASLGGGGAAAAWNPGRLPGTPREWLAGPDYCFTDGSASFTAASSQFLSVPSNATLQTGDVDFWVAGWVNLTSNAGNQVVLSKTVGSTGEFQFFNSGGTFLFDTYTGAASLAGRVFTTMPTAGTWVFAVGYQSVANNQVGVSLNGGAFVTATRTGTPTTNTTPLAMGAFSGGASGFLGGRLASVAFGKSPPGGIASVATTIRDRLYAGGNGIVYADTTSAERTAWGLVSWWDLVRSGNFTDSHGSNNLTNNNGVGFGAGLPRARAGDTDPVSAWVDRWQGTTVAMTDPLKRPTLRLVSGRWVVRGDGVNDCILINAAGLTLAQPYTAWAAHTKTSGTTTNGVIADSDSNVTAAFFYGDVPSTASAVLSLGSGGTAVRSAVTSGATAAVAVFNGASSRLRANQVEVTGNPGSGSLTGLRLFDIRADLVTNYRLAGDIASFGLLNSAISVGDQARLESYLNTIYPSY